MPRAVPEPLPAGRSGPLRVLPQRRSWIRWAYSFGFYEDALRKLIHLFKYGRVETFRSRWGGYWRGPFRASKLST